MADWFILHPDPAKKMYMMIVMAMEPMYMDIVEPTRSVFQAFESVDSTFSKQNSAQV